MKKKISKLVGLSFSEFEEFIESGQIKLSKARLIPLLKMGDEMALTSIFLTALRLVKEFRYQIFKDAKLSKAGRAYYFTEICFPDLSESRIDGLLIIVSAGKIKDAAFFEMKNKNNKINAAQIGKYCDLAKKLGAGNMITVSNEFVSESKYVPYDLKAPKSVSLYHYSWTYILTISKILLQKNQTNIDDDDQTEIMKEVVAYLEHKDSGVSGFTKMKSGWKEVVEKIISNAPIKVNDKIVEEAVLSWQQEEKDMALMLSRELGVLVGQGLKSKKQTTSGLSKQLVNDHVLSSSLSVEGSVSDLEIEAVMGRRTISMAVIVDAPLDKGTKGKVGWIGRQLEGCRKKNSEGFEAIENYIWVEAQIKYTSNHERVKYEDIDQLAELDKSKEVVAFKICLVEDAGRKFDSVKKFVETIESMLVDYYQILVQNLSNWDRPAPKIKD
ncbi:hypothetical protein [Ekhidna sp. To15]|uniref:hypothetical protein n=1 Tax=Ekhidna sp. To15 TaxID=3395267 RepID=UPI003F5228C5